MFSIFKDFVKLFVQEVVRWCLSLSIASLTISSGTRFFTFSDSNMSIRDPIETLSSKSSTAMCSQDRWVE